MWKASYAAERARILGLGIFLIGCGGGTGEAGQSTSGDPGGDDQSGPSTGSGTGSACTAIGPPLSLGLGTTPSVVWTGAAFAIAYQSKEVDDGDIHLATIDESGDLLSTSSLLSADITSAVPAIAKHGDGLLTVWRDSDGKIRGHALDKAASPVGPTIDIAATQDLDTRPRLVSAGSGAMVAWSDTSASVVGLFENAGLSATATLDGARFPALAPRGGATGVAFSDGGSVGLVEISGANLQSGPKVTSEATAQNLAVASDGDRFVVAWEDLRTGTEQVYAAWMDSGGAEQASIPSSGDSANWPSVAWTGTHAAIAYYQFRKGPPSIYLALVGKDLKRVADVEVTPGLAARFPAVAWSGHFLAVAYAIKDGDVQVVVMACN